MAKVLSMCTAIVLARDMLANHHMLWLYPQAGLPNRAVLEDLDRMLRLDREPVFMSLAA